MIPAVRRVLPVLGRAARCAYFGGGLLLLLAGVATADDLGLTIIHSNDVHARLEPAALNGARCRDEDIAANRCFGGAARLAGQIAAWRQSEPNTLLLDAGDQFQGTLFHTRYKGLASAEIMNLMAYDAMALGNHEFDNGPATLATFIKAVKFSVLSANIDALRDTDLAGRFAPYTVIERGGSRIGIIGATVTDTPLISSPGPGLAFSPVAEAMGRAVDELHRQGVTRIIALTHIGLSADRQLAREVDGIAVIVGGHSHSLISNVLPNALGPYPIVERSPAGRPVLVVTSNEWGRVLGKLSVRLDDDGTPVTWSGDVTPMDRAAPEDAGVAAVVARLAEPLEETRHVVVGDLAAELPVAGGICRLRECALGDLVADAMLSLTRDVDVAIVNGGGLRAGIPAGPVTLGTILEVLPFGNTVATLGLRGSDVRAALEHGVGRADNAQNDGTGRFPQVAGLRYAFDPKRPVGQRILDVQFQTADGSYRPLDPGRLYRVATNNFMRAGGDGYAVFKEKAVDPYDFGANLDELVIQYLGTHRPARTALDGRIRRVD